MNVAHSDTDEIFAMNIKLLKVSQGVPITLNPGWNRIAFEAESYWPGDWSAWAALSTKDERPLQ